MNTKIDDNGLVWSERETVYGRAYDLEGSPPGSCGFSVLEVEPSGHSSTTRRPIIVAKLTMVTTGLIATWLVF